MINHILLLPSKIFCKELHFFFMAASLVSPELFQLERKVDLLHISHYQIIGDVEYHQAIQSLKKAQSDFSSDDPELQKNAIKVFIFVSGKYGFGKGTLPPFFFKRIKELIFGNHASVEVIEISLQLVESIIEMSPWTIESFLKLDFPKVLFDNLKSNAIGIPPDKISFILNAFLEYNTEAYFILKSLGYYEYVLELSTKELPKIDILWVLIAIQSITASQFFDKIDSLHNIVNIAIKYFEMANNTGDLDIMCLTYFLFGRCLASYDILTEPELRAICDPNIIQAAYFLIEKKLMPNIRSVFNYVQNYIYNDENTLEFISMGFVQLFHQIFTLCENDYQIQILDILNNAAVSPFESTLEILKSPIIREYIPGIFETGRLSLKKTAITLVLTLVVKVPLFSQHKLNLNTDPNADEVEYLSGDIIFTLINNIFRSIIDLLISEDDDIIRYCLQVLHHITSEIQVVQPSQAKKIFDLFNFNVREALFDISQCNDEISRALSDNVIKSLNYYSSALEKEMAQ